MPPSDEQPKAPQPVQYHQLRTTGATLINCDITDLTAQPANCFRFKASIKFERAGKCLVVCGFTQGAKGEMGFARNCIGTKTIAGDENDHTQVTIDVPFSMFGPRNWRCLLLDPSTPIPFAPEQIGKGCLIVIAPLVGSVIYWLI